MASRSAAHARLTMQEPISAVLQDGRRHFQHGPIDIIAYAEGEHAMVEHAHAAAWRRFKNVLNELTSELTALRQPIGRDCPLKGSIAKTMWQACNECSDEFITPMAAVAGAVAQALIEDYRLPGISRAWINNGGDIAVHMTPGHSLKIGLFSDLSRLTQDMIEAGVAVDGIFEITQGSGVRGIATSGWRGRSHSLGLADSVTVLATTAAHADAAATVIANQVNVDDPRIVRLPANTLKDNSDLGEIPVTVDVPALSEEKVHTALQQGLRRAKELKNKGLIISAVITCQGWVTSTDMSTCSRMVNT